MKAVVYDHFGDPEVLQLKEVPTPVPKANEVLIRLSYSGVNPVDAKIRMGYFKDAMPHNFPVIPGWEGAGVVTEVGERVKDLQVNDTVYGYFRQPEIGHGTYAEYIAVPEELVVKIPRELSLKESSSIPLVTLTAWQALFDAAKLQPHETILIHAAAGGVGGMAVQLAHLKGAKVFATAQEHNHEYVKKLGADVVIDYKKQDVRQVLFSHVPQGVDVVLDCVGGHVTDESFMCVKPVGRVVSVVDRTVVDKAPKNVKAQFVFVAPNQKQLKEIGDLLDVHKLMPLRLTEFSLADARKAQELIMTGQTVGKLVLRI